MILSNRSGAGGEIELLESSGGKATLTSSWSLLRSVTLGPGTTHEALEGMVTAASPSWVDQAGGDYHLHRDSPLIDAGTAAGAPETDLGSAPRPQGEAPDVRADEAEPRPLPSRPKLLTLTRAGTSIPAGVPYDITWDAPEAYTKFVVLVSTGAGTPWRVITRVSAPSRHVTWTPLRPALQLLQAEPDSLEALLGLAEAYRRQGQPSQSLLALGLALQLALARRKLRWIALKNNLPGPAMFVSDRAQKWLLSQDSKLNPIHRLAGRQLLDQIITLERQLADTDAALRATVATHAELAPTLALIQTVPGVGFIIALTTLCECGDIRRFDSIDELSSYAGLCPRVTQSGECAHHGHISKQGPTILRWALQQAAWVAIRCDPNARRIYARIAKRAGSKKAATALARKLLSYAWSVCRQGHPFVCPSNLPTGPGPVPVWSYDI